MVKWFIKRSIMLADRTPRPYAASKVNLSETIFFTNLWLNNGLTGAIFYLKSYLIKQYKGLKEILERYKGYKNGI